MAIPISIWIILETEMDKVSLLQPVGQRKKPELTAEHAESAEEFMKELSERIIGAAIEVHKILGPGLLESTYELCLGHELLLWGIHAVRQIKQPINYKGLQIDEGYRIDILAEWKIILKLKVVEQFNNVHMAQLLTYLESVPEAANFSATA